VAFAVGNDGADECGEGLGQLDGNPAEAKADVLIADVDVFDGEAADRGGALGVEENE